MKKLLALLLLAAATWSPAATAQVQISKVEAANPTEEVFMDMAVTVAQTAVAQGHKPCGAVVTLNGAWRASGMAVGGATAEEDAIARTRRSTVPMGVMFTVNQPTDRALDAIAAAGIATVYYVNPLEDVIAAGIATADDYSAASSPRDGLKVIRIDYAPARQLLK